MQRKSVGIVIFDDVEVLDFCGPFEVFSVTRLNEEKRQEEPSPFEVILVAEDARPVKSRGGMKVIPDHTFASCPQLDVLVVPGGWGTRAQIKKRRLVGVAQRAFRRAENTNLRLYWINATWPRGAVRGTTRNYSLALARSNAGCFSKYYR